MLLNTNQPTSQHVVVYLQCIKCLNKMSKISYMTWHWRKEFKDRCNSKKKMIEWGKKGPARACKAPQMALISNSWNPQLYAIHSCKTTSMGSVLCVMCLTVYLPAFASTKLYCLVTESEASGCSKLNVSMQQLHEPKFDALPITPPCHPKTSDVLMFSDTEIFNCGYFFLLTALIISVLRASFQQEMMEVAMWQMKLLKYANYNYHHTDRHSVFHWRDTLLVV